MPDSKVHETLPLGRLGVEKGLKVGRRDCGGEYVEERDWGGMKRMRSGIDEDSQESGEYDTPGTLKLLIRLCSCGHVSR